MTRPITLFTGQWADLPFEEVCRLASGWGYDGLEIACWGDHLDVVRAAEDDAYVRGQLDVLERHGLQAVGDLQPPRRAGSSATTRSTSGTAASCRDRIWGDGDPEGVRRRAAEEMKATARAARALGVDVVIGFTGSNIWKTVAMFPPVPQSMVDAGTRTSPTGGTRSSTSSTRWASGSPTRCTRREIAYDYWTTMRALEAIGHRPAFGLNWDPSHFVWQDLDPVGFLWDFRDRIYHVDCKDAKRQVGNGRNGRMGSHLPWADPRRGWDFVSTGHGDVPWEACFRMLNTIGYAGPISVEWEDAGMDRLVGAPEALAFVRRLAFDPPAAAFDAAFSAG